MKQLVVSFIVFFLSTLLVLTKAQEQILLRKLVKSGAKIYSLDEKISYQISEPRFFYVSYDDPEKPVFVTLHDRNKNEVFKTSYQNIEDAEAVVNINPKYDATTEYKKPTRYLSDDKKFEYNLRPTLTFESLAIDDLSELYLSELSSAQGNRFELKAIIPSSLGIDFGLVLNYQSIYWENNQEEVQFSSVNAGPYLEMPLGKWGVLEPSLNFGVELSLKASGSSGLFRDEFSKTVWHLGFQNTYLSSYGPFFAEVFYRKHDLILNKTNRSIETQSKSYAITSLGLALGYRWDLTL